MGRRDAILEVAAAPGALATGALLVLSAALAREYDGEDLLHEPWHLAIPFAASVASALLLWSLVWLAALRGARDRPGWLAGFRPFLACYWLTAPLAWLYAIPFERFGSPVGAVRANLACLGLVALWRVVLMIRVVAVLWQASIRASAALVLGFADAVALAAMLAVPAPVIEIMGGIRHSPADDVLLGARFAVLAWGCLALPVVAIAAGAAVLARKPGWRWSPPPPSAGPAPRGARWLALAAVVAGAALLPLAQGEQSRRGEVERALRAGRIAEGLVLLSRHPPDAFPPLWDPPPRLGYGRQRPELLGVLEALADAPGTAPWVRACYLEKLDRLDGHHRIWHTPESRERLRAALQRIPGGEAALDRLRRWQ